MHSSLLSVFFYNLGLCIRQAPAVFIALPVLAVIVASCGLFHGLQIDTDANKIWVPPGSITAQQKEYFDAAFDPFFRVNQVIVSLQDLDGKDAGPTRILQPQYLQALFALQERLTSGATASGVTLDDVCFRPIPGKGCLLETPLDWFKSNATVIDALTLSDIQDGIACRQVQDLAGIPCVSSIGVPVMKEVVLGEAACPTSPIPGFNASVCGSCGGTSATALMITVLLQATPALTDAGAEWEQQVFLPAVAAFSYPGLRVSYMAERSISDELSTVNSQNQATVFISYVVMLLYVAVALGKTPHPVASRALLGLQGMLIVAASVAGALGVAAWCGLHITMIVLEVVPFLILAIGVDNVFIITKALDRAWKGPARAWKGHGRTAGAGSAGLTADDALPVALAEVGPTITAASMCEVTAFAVGITTDIPALSQFCIVAAIAVAIDFLLQITWFAAAELLDARRQEAGRADVCPCFVVRRRDPGAEEGYEAIGLWGEGVGSAHMRGASSLAAGTAGERFLSGVEEEGRDGMDVPSTPSSLGPLLPKDEGLQRGYGPRAGVAEGGAEWRQEGEGEEGEEEDEEDARAQHPRGWLLYAQQATNQGGFVRTFLSKYWAPFVLSPPVRVTVIATWLSFLALSLWAGGQLPLGLEQQLVLPTGSYLSTYFSDQSRLGDAGPPMYVVLQGVNYSHPNASAGISDLANILASRLPDVLVPPIYSWAGDFAIWGSDATRALIAANPGWGCPPPLDPSVAPLAARAAQFVYGVPIDSYCCQGQGFCGGQYASDVKFLWGVPKGGGSNVSTHAATTAAAAGVSAAGGTTRVHVSKTGHALTIHTSGGTPPPSTGVGGGVDDGGCDASVGYLSHAEVEGAVGGGGGGVSTPRVSAPPHRLPSRVHAPLASAYPSLRVGGYDSGNVTLIPCHILTSRLRGQHVPLRNQSDFISSMQKVQAAVNTLQAALLPIADLSVYGISGYGPLAPGAPTEGGAWSNGSAPVTPDPAYTDDNGHTSWLPPAPGGAAFPYSLVYVYYEQYGYIRGVAVASGLLAVGAVFLASLAVTNLAVAGVTMGLVASITLSMVGWVWALNPRGPVDPFGGGPYGVSVNAVSVVNAITAAGLSVEFVIHIASAYYSGVGMRQQGGGGGGKESDGAPPPPYCSARARKARLAGAHAALVVLGSPVVTGITLTKLVGVLVLSTAPSALFRLYYFRMYLGIIVLGAFHGLALLPALLVC